MSKTTTEIYQDYENEIFRAASELYADKPHWIVFYRDVLGVEGVVRRFFSEKDEREAFERSQKYGEIQQMLVSLFEHDSSMQDESEPSTSVTIRVPKCLHRSLSKQAKEHNTTLNKWCVTKLLQPPGERWLDDSEEE